MNIQKMMTNISLQNNRARTQRRILEKLCFAFLNLQKALGAVGSPGKLRRSSGRALGSRGGALGELWGVKTDKKTMCFYCFL